MLYYSLPICLENGGKELQTRRMSESRPIATDVKTFVPTKNYEESLKYYQAIGWKLLWKRDDLSELELGNTRIYLQKYYNKDWAVRT